MRKVLMIIKAVVCLSLGVPILAAPVFLYFPVRGIVECRRCLRGEGIWGIADRQSAAAQESGV